MTNAEIQQWLRSREASKTLTLAALLTYLVVINLGHALVGHHAERNLGPDREGISRIARRGR
jgi:hypothetical protein